jgi:hypothetical protein
MSAVMEMSKPVRTVLAVDIGVQNMGLAFAEFDAGKPVVRWVAVADLTCIQHTRIPRETCCLNHSSEFADRIAHLCQEYPEFETATTLLVERQPVVSAFGIAIQNLLLQRYHKRLELVSPNSLHKHFGIGLLDYEQRKDWVVAEFLRGEPAPAVLKQFNCHERQHDMADAAMMIVFWWERRANRERLEQKSVQSLGGLTAFDYLDRFKFKNNHEIKTS